MTRIKFTNSNEVHELPVVCGSKSATIPVDGEFHEIDADLLPALDDSSVEYEIENADAAREIAADAGGAAGMGGSTAPPKRRSRAKAAAKKAASAVKRAVSRKKK
jgi:hypothetical protein